jgi:NAD dependent epimerase/dehydratase
VSQDLSGKAVLVTGADGFIGSHLVERLVGAGARVRAFVFYNSWNQIGWLRDVPHDVLKEVEIFPGDVRDAERVREAARGCEFVFHLASLIAIPYSYSAARSYVDTNVHGALNVLQACRESDRLVRLVHVSTSEVYGSAQHVPIPETHPLVGQSPYAATKIAADKVAESFHLSFGLPVVTARPFNTYGPRQTARAVIPTIASQLLSGGGRLKLGALHPTRDFNYVADTVEGMVALSGCKQAEGEVVNIGSGREWSIAQVVEMLAELTGRNAIVESEAARLRPERSEVNRLLADTSKMRRLTGWQSRVALREGLSRTMEWIARNPAAFDPGRYHQ